MEPLNDYIPSDPDATKSDTEEEDNDANEEMPNPEASHRSPIPQVFYG